MAATVLCTCDDVSGTRIARETCRHSQPEIVSGDLARTQHVYSAEVLDIKKNYIRQMNVISTCVAIPVLDLSCHGHECLFHIGGILGTCLEEWDTNLVSKCLCIATVLTAVNVGLGFNYWSRAITFAVWVSTTFFAVKSLLLPTSNLFTFSFAYLSISLSHCLTLLKLS